jgi:hypothetical protein
VNPFIPLAVVAVGVIALTGTKKKRISNPIEDRALLPELGYDDDAAGIKDFQETYNLWLKKESEIPEDGAWGNETAIAARHAHNALSKAASGIDSFNEMAWEDSLGV